MFRWHLMSFYGDGLCLTGFPPLCALENIMQTPGPTRRTVGDGTSAIASFAAALNKPDFSDVTFIVGAEKQSFHAHRSILAARSDVFRRMLYGGFKETSDREICIPEFDAGHFYTTLEWAYTGQARMTARDVLGVLRIARFYAYDDLELHCRSLAIDFIDARNCLTLLDAALRMGEADIELSALRYLSRNLCDAIADDETWCNVSMTAVERVLSLEVLDCSEDWLLQRLMRWVERQPAPVVTAAADRTPSNKLGGGGSPLRPTAAGAQRFMLFLSLLPKIRFPQLSNDRLVHSVKTIVSWLRQLAQAHSATLTNVSLTGVAPLDPSRDTSPEDAAVGAKDQGELPDATFEFKSVNTTAHDGSGYQDDYGGAPGDEVSGNSVEQQVADAATASEKLALLGPVVEALVTLQMGELLGKDAPHPTPHTAISVTPDAIAIATEVLRACRASARDHLAGSASVFTTSSRNAVTLQAQHVSRSVATMLLASHPSLGLGTVATLLFDAYAEALEFKLQPRAFAAGVPRDVTLCSPLLATATSTPRSHSQVAAATYAVVGDSASVVVGGGTADSASPHAPSIKVAAASFYSYPFASRIPSHVCQVVYDVDATYLLPRGGWRKVVEAPAGTLLSHTTIVKLPKWASYIAVGVRQGGTINWTGSAGVANPAALAASAANNAQRKTPGSDRITRMAIGHIEVALRGRTHAGSFDRGNAGGSGGGANHQGLQVDGSIGWFLSPSIFGFMPKDEGVTNAVLHQTFKHLETMVTATQQQQQQHVAFGSPFGSPPGAVPSLPQHASRDSSSGILVGPVHWMLDSGGGGGSMRSPVNGSCVVSIDVTPDGDIVQSPSLMQLTASAPGGTTSTLFIYVR